MIGVALGGAEHRQQAVTDELVGMTSMGEDHWNDDVVEAVQAHDDITYSGALCERGEAAYVHEQD